ncbi:hypothetical protein M9Y10_043126 [Tritrichomonas musculus]|uniref:Transcription and mRNA export factor SUS1 n=1 Tax=Tritrichomonas musculus TaxID=1915356 RepID=A0ABR2GMQ3_9EUKA
MDEKEFTPEEIHEYQNKVLHYLEKNNEVDKIRDFISRKVEESNWRDVIRKMSGKKMDDESIEELNPDSVTNMILDQAMEALPAELQSFVEQKITDSLTSKKILADSISNPK